jgi:protein-S-isoprenylcysteine O-methyltransferase Ste14
VDTARENNAKLRVEPGFGAATYRIALGWRLAAMGVYAVIAAGALAGVCGMLFGATPSAATTLGIALLAGLLALATWAVLVMVKWSVTLSSDAIVASGLWRTRQLGRSEIAGVRLWRSGRAG